MKRRYEKPEVRVQSIDVESLLAYSGYRVDKDMKGQVLEDDWDEDNWGFND